MCTWTFTHAFRLVGLHASTRAHTCLSCATLHVHASWCRLERPRNGINKSREDSRQLRERRKRKAGRPAGSFDLLAPEEWVVMRRRGTRVFVACQGPASWDVYTNGLGFRRCVARRLRPDASRDSHYRHGLPRRSRMTRSTQFEPHLLGIAQLSSVRACSSEPNSELGEARS